MRVLDGAGACIECAAHVQQRAHHRKTPLRRRYRQHWAPRRAATWRWCSTGCCPPCCALLTHTHAFTQNLQTLPAALGAKAHRHLAAVLDWLLPPVLRFARRGVKEMSPTQDATLARAATRIIGGLLGAARDAGGGGGGGLPPHLRRRTNT